MTITVTDTTAGQPITEVPAPTAPDEGDRAADARAELARLLAQAYAAAPLFP